MATNDQISVDIVAQTQGYNAALNQAASQTENFGARASAATARAESGFSALSNTVASFAGGLLAGISFAKIIELGERSIETANKIEKMSQQVGIATDELSALQSQAQLADVGFDQFGNAMDRLARSASLAAGGGKMQQAAYAALGITVTTASGQMRPMSDILQDVATKMSGFADGASKTALAQELMGRSGAQLIPLLNQLGSQGFDAVRKAAEDYNQVIGPDQARQSETLHDNFVRLQQAVSGFANAVVQNLLPGLVAMSTDMAEAAKTNSGYSDSAAIVANSIKSIVLAFSIVKETLSSAVTIMIGFYDAVATSFSATYQVIAAWATQVHDKIAAAFKLDGAAFAAAGDQYTAALTRIGTDVGNKFKTIGSNISGAMHTSIANVTADVDHLFGSMSAGATQAATDVHKPQAPIVNLGTAASDSAKLLRELDAAMDKLASDGDALAAKLGGPYVAAQSAYNQTIRQLQNDAEAAAIAGGNVDAIIVQWQADEEKAAAVLAKTNDEIEQQHNLFAAQAQDLSNLMQVMQLEPQYRDAATAALKKYDELMKSHYDFYGNYIRDEKDLKAALDAQLPGYEQGLQHIKDLTDAEKASDQATKDWVNIWTNAGDNIANTFAKILVEGGSLFDGLKSLAQQTVEAIISYFEKLAIINPILNAIFGTAVTGGAGLLPTLANAGISTAAGSLFSNVLAGGSSTASVTASNFGSSGISLFNAGKTIWDGFSNGFSTFFGSGGSQSMLGSLTGTGEFDFGGSTAGTIGSVAGGAIAGWQIGSQLGGTTGGVLGAAGLGVAAYFVPVIGWIAGAAALINSLTGGGLFGSAGKFNFGQTALTVGAGGATATAGYDLKGKKPLFGGSTHEWVSVAPDQAAIDAANQFYKQLLNGTDAFAQSFGTKAGSIIGGQFLQNYDSKGNPTTSSDTVLGVTYNDTQQQFAERLQAENMLAVLGNFDNGLNAAVDQFRANADQLMAVTQALANGETMMQAGTQFLALGTDQSLTSLLKLAEGSQQFGESIDQTLARLEQAQSAYDQFVAQFKPAASYVDDFEGALSQINATMNANIKQANALAIAAGAQGASEKDLANIHAYAAKQAADAIAALEASAQSLAFSLGLTTVGSLDQVNQEIASLQAKANSGSSAVSSFGNAIQAAAQKASAAISLLIGDLSPLNDQQKLQTALQGLRAGTVTADQVLTIGKRLYASSQQYVDLFNMVKSMGGSGAATGGGGVAATHGGLSAADSKRLADLLKEQSQLQASAQLQQYQTLAQQVAEIASAKGEDWQQVLKDMNVNIADFEKGLGLNDKQTGDYIDAIQKQTDSNGDNTQSIIAVLNQILTALGGTPTGDPGGHSGHSTGRTLTVDDIIRGVRDGIARGLGDVGHQGPRNLRGLQIPIGVR